jgi:hypothetical protein
MHPELIDAEPVPDRSWKPMLERSSARGTRWEVLDVHEPWIACPPGEQMLDAL